MEILRVEIPDYRLAPFVCCFAHRETLPGSEPITQPLIASLGAILSFDLGDRVVYNRPGLNPYFPAHADLLGTQTRYFGQACLSGHVLEFGIFFRTFALWQLFGIPPAELVDHDGDATEVISSWIAELWCKLVEAGSFAERITLATRTLLPLVNTARPLTSIMSTVHRLLPTSSGDAARIVQVARDSAMSMRSYERQFAAEMGFPPKTFFRLARFDKAVDAKRRTRDSWLNISHELGYFDQMHMIRDFRLLGGETPGRLFVPNADFQPWSIRNPPESW
jgi:AraC-like DNA-binding protein